MNSIRGAHLALPAILLLTVLCFGADDGNRNVDSLIEQLGANSPSDRESAERMLGERGPSVVGALLDATLSEDAERVRRARRLIVRLEGRAFPELTRAAKSSSKKRAFQARLLMAGLTERLVQRKVTELLARIEAAADEKRITTNEKSNWLNRLNRGQVELAVDENGQVVESGLERQLACREALTPEAISGRFETLAEELESFRTGKDAPVAPYEAGWKVFAERHGDVQGQRALFADMIQAEPALMASAAEVLSADKEEALRRGRLLGGLFDLRTQDFNSSFRESMKGMRAQAGKSYPDVYDKQTLGRLSAFLFVRGRLSEHVPTPTLSGVTTQLTTGMAGYYSSKQPLYEMIKNPSDDRSKTVRSLLIAAALSADSGADLEKSLTVAMYYRLQDVCRELARRILDGDPKTYDNEGRKQSTRLLAAHALMSFGRTPDDLTITTRLLADDTQVRLGGYRKEDNRKFIEIREMGLMASLKLLKRKPEQIGGASKVTGYCPIKRFTKFDAIRKAERWVEIVAKIRQWTQEAGPEDAK